MMLLGAVLFAQLVGSFCGLASALSPGKAQFRFDLSDLNAVMEAEAVPSGLRFRLRECASPCSPPPSARGLEPSALHSSARLIGASHRRISSAHLIGASHRRVPQPRTPPLIGPHLPTRRVHAARACSRSTESFCIPSESFCLCVLRLIPSVGICIRRHTCGRPRRVSAS